MSVEHNENVMKSPNLHFRDSTKVWGPLCLTLTKYREGAELGFEAGQVAYWDNCPNTEEAMQYYLATPRYRPRACTLQIVEEWRAMFVLGWTSQLFEEQKQG